MQLVDGAAAIEIAAAQRDLGQHMIHIGVDAVEVMGDDLVAAAVETGAGAKRNMYIGGEGPPVAGAGAGGRCPLVGIRRNAAVEVLRRRIRSVPGSFSVVAAHTVGVK